MLDEIGIAGSRKRIPDFGLQRPGSLDDAVSLLRQAGASPILFHAGGLDVTNRLKLAPAAATIMHVGGIADLRRISCDAKALHIGATATHAEIASHPDVATCQPDLARYVGGLGNVRVRMQGTIGGNVMSGDPNYEMLPVLAALDATLNLTESATSHPILLAARDWPARGSAFMRHLLTSISIPRRPTSLVWFRELRPALGFVAAMQWDGERAISACAALTGDRRGVLVRSYEFGSTDRAEIGTNSAHHVSTWAQSFPDVETPLGPDARYCRHVLAVWLRRALTQMLGTGG